LPHAKLYTLDRCGHVPQIECPAALTSALKEILDTPPRNAK
jgi:pimeloyl-ACP methyl ester carboxylesterase